MTTTFETWLTKNSTTLPEVSVRLFKDSLRCYHTKIERPAYLLAYQAMLVYIREQLKKGKPPMGFSESEWQNTLKEISKEEAWDIKLIDIVLKEEDKSKGKDAPLQMPHHVRRQFEYWRQLRNTCAHYKSDPFVSAHVLTLYAFIEHWLMKLSVTGGLESMLGLIREYCDPAKTPVSAPVLPILNKIPDYIIPEEAREYVIASMKIFGKSPFRKALPYIIELMNLSGSLEYIAKATVHLLQEEDKSDIRDIVIKHHPERVLQLLKEEQIREYWYNSIDCRDEGEMIALCHLIEANKLTEDEIKECFGQILSKGYKFDMYLPNMSPEVNAVFEKHGYYDMFFEVYMSPNYVNDYSNFSKICNATNFYISHLTHVNLDNTKVERIINGLNPAAKAPYVLRDRFVSELLNDRDDKSFRQKFEKVAEESQLELPKEWK